MIRHEIIALHLATTFGKAEFYPSCSQIKVGGSETGVPNPDEYVTFPGGYDDDDPGIYDPDVFEASAPYVFPGPPVASFVNGTTTSTSGSSSSSSTMSLALMIITQHVTHSHNLSAMITYTQSLDSFSFSLCRIVFFIV